MSLWEKLLKLRACRRVSERGGRDGVFAGRSTLRARLTDSSQSANSAGGDSRHTARDERCWESSRMRSEEHTSELQSRRDLVCRLLLEKKKSETDNTYPNSKLK